MESIEYSKGRPVSSIQDVSHLSLKTLSTPFGVYLDAGTIVHCDEDETTYELTQSVKPSDVLKNVSKKSYGSTTQINDSYYVYEQNLPASIWTIKHDMGKHPSVSVTDTAGTQVIGSVNYIDDNNLTVTFSAPFSGYAYLN